jgi:hypothetical protein
MGWHAATDGAAMTEPEERVGLENADFDLAEDWAGLSFEDKITALKATVTVPEVASLMGIEADEGDKIPSPWNPTERTPSCHLYDDHFYDYGTGKGGDIFDLVIALNPGTTLAQAVQAIKQRAVSVGKQYGDVESAVPRELLDFGPQLAGFGDLFDFNGLVLPKGWAKIDDQQNIYIPHREPARTYGVKVRWAAGGKSSWAGSQYSHRLYDPWGWSAGYVPNTRVVLCEGESDCWALYLALHEHADVLALPSGAGTWKDHWLDDLGPYNRVYVCMDNDRAGKIAKDKLMLKVGYSRAERLDVPQLFNDAREALAAGWVPSL